MNNFEQGIQRLGFRQHINGQILSKTTACFCGLKGHHITAQGKTEGRHPGSSLSPPIFYDSERVTQKNVWHILYRPLGGMIFWG